MIRRVLWSAGRLFFRYSLRPMFGWRRFVLRLFGATVGKGVHVYPSATIYFPWNLSIGDWSSIGEEALIYNLGPINIGERTTISQRAHLCAGTHDYTQVDLPLLKPPITVGNQVWICADVFIGPGVTIADNAIAGARAVVIRDVGSDDIVAGNPARVVSKRDISSTGPSD